MVIHSFSTIIRRHRSGGDLHSQAQVQTQPRSPGFIARSVQKTRSLFSSTDRSQLAPSRWSKDASQGPEVPFVVQRRLPRPALDLDNVFTAISSRSESPSTYSQDSLRTPDRSTFCDGALGRDKLSSPQQSLYPRHSFLCISESDHIPNDVYSRELPLAPPNKDHISIPRASQLADKTRAALERMRSSLRKSSRSSTFARPAKHASMGDNLLAVPRLTLYDGKGREPPLSSQFPDAFLSQPPLGAQWLEPLDMAPQCLDASRLSAVHHGHPRPLSWPSILPHCPDHMPGTSESVLDFRTAADLVRDYDVPALQCDDDDDDADDEDEDDEALVTPHRDRPPTPFGLDFALRSAWSDSESEFVNVEADLDVDVSACSAMDDSAHKSLLAFPSASAREDRSLVSLSLWPSPPGSPSFSEQFAVGRPAFPYLAPSTPTRTRRLARSPSPLFYSEDPESPTLRTARIRCETMARLEGRLAANRT